ncbi:hypothetical protein AAHY29_06595 [Klebsiella pneumoniae]|nr:hypothetical protein [Klebsiella pneumoniae]HBV3506731.1 hypothetical protein [Klebsiella pneumoniae]
MRKVEIVSVTDEHICAILPHVRQADHDEFMAAAGMTPAEVITRAMKSASVAAAGMINGQVVTIFGISPASIITGRGIPWLVSTDHIEHQPLTFLRHCRPVLRDMSRGYRVLENYVDARNHAAKSWLHWMGFTLADPEPYGLKGMPFHHFTKEIDHV